MSGIGSPMGRAFAALAAGIMATVAFAAPANAASTEAEVATAQACWLDLDTERTLCFDSAESLEKHWSSSGLEVRSEPTTSSAEEAAALEASGRGEFGLLAVYTVAILWEHASYGGAALYITTGNSWMCSGTEYHGNLGSSWNDRVSSFQSYGGCRTRLAEHINQGGWLYGPYTSASSLGGFNDLASSYKVLA